jgi:WD40 repeat protein
VDDSDAGFDVVGLPISTYEVHDPLPADDEVARVVTLLNQLGGVGNVWQEQPSGRTRTGVGTWLAKWADHKQPRSSLLLWMGHGESIGTDAWLAVYETREPMSGTGIKPADFADHIANEWLRRAGDDPPTWTVVVIEACGAETFVDRLIADLFQRPNRPKRLALLGVGGIGASHLGEFHRALELTLNSYTDNDDDIQLNDLMLRLQSRILPGTVLPLDLHTVPPLPRHRLLPGTVTAPVDIYTELAEFLAELSPDERGHFIPKAQGAEQGELAWYFVGREQERREISTWLRTASTGMLVVTGRAGVGKSALLGNVVIQANPALRELLIQAGHLPSVGQLERPPDGALDAVIHLTGMTTSELVRRLAETGLPPSDRQGPAEPGAEVDWLLAGLRRRREPFTVLLDALDEAQEPTVTASSVLRRVAALPQCRVVIGTRASTHEGPDEPDPVDEDILDALGHTASTRTLRVDRDPQAVADYIRLRLAAARAAGKLSGDSATIEDVAELMQAKNRQFLYARLAIHEILARPGLLAPDRRGDLVELLSRDHRALFASAVERLAAQFRTAYPLLEALALAQGRGLPRADRIWAAVASALADDRLVTEDDLDRLLAEAAPYIMLDAEYGQSVYRLSHRTFQEYFVSRQTAQDRLPDRVQPSAQRHRLVVRALIALCGAAPPAALNRYATRYLARHVAEANAWRELADVPDVLDQLSPDAVAAEVLRTAFGRPGLPAEIAAVLSARHLLAMADPVDRRGIRQLAIAQFTDQLRTAQAGQGGSAAWQVRWAKLRSRPLHMVLAGTTAPMEAMVAVPLPDGRVLLATGSEDSTVRLWDPTTGTPASDPLTGQAHGVTAAAAVPLRDGRVLLATGSWDGTVRLWDPATGTPVGDPMACHALGVTAAAAVQLPDKRFLLATGSADHTVRLWDPDTRTPASDPLIGHTDWVTAAAAVPRPDGRVLLATGSWDGTVRLWDPDTRTPAGGPIACHELGVTAAAAVQLPDKRFLLATGSADHTVRLWDPDTRMPVGDPLIGHTSRVTTATAVPLPDGPVLLATGSADRTVRLWDPVSRTPAGDPLTGHTSRVTTATAVPLPDGRVLLATGSWDRTVRLWDPAQGASARDTLTSHDGTVHAVTAVPLADGRSAVGAGDAAGTVRLWDAGSGVPVGDPLMSESDYGAQVTAIVVVPRPHGGTLVAVSSRDSRVRLWNPVDGGAAERTLSRDSEHGGRVTAMVVVPGPDGQSMLVAASADRTLRLWDPESGLPLSDPLPVPASRVTAATSISLPGQQVLVLTGSADGSVRLWDPAANQLFGDPLAGSASRVTAVAAVPLHGRVLVAMGSVDGTVRLWDPTVEDSEGDPLTGHTGAVYAAAAVPLPNSRTLVATGGEDGTVRLWDPVTRKHVHTLMLDAPVFSLAAIDSGIAIGSQIGALVIDLNPAQMSVR